MPERFLATVPVFVRIAETETSPAIGLNISCCLYKSLEDLMFTPSICLKHLLLLRVFIFVWAVDPLLFFADPDPAAFINADRDPAAL